MPTEALAPDLGFPDSSRRRIAALTVFLGSWNAAIPIQAATDVPWPLRPIQAIPGLPFDQLLLLLAIATTLPSINRAKWSRRTGEAWALVLFLALGGLGFVSNLINGAPLNEMGEVARLLMFGLALPWYGWLTFRFGTASLLSWITAGLAAGGLVNITCGILVDGDKVGALPLLIGQNGPGPGLGFLVLVAAWLFMLSEAKEIRLLCAIAAVIGIYCAIISYSKIALVIAALGAVSWLAILLSEVSRRRLIGLVIAAAVALAMVASIWRSAVEPFVDSATTIIAIKFSEQDLDFGDADSNIRGTRLLFWPAVAEIVMESPVFGVGYAGFADAYNRTETSRNPRAYVEDEQGSGPGSSDSNPHCTILYYASANGILGLIGSLCLMASMQVAMYRSCSRLGGGGRVLGFAFVIAVLIWALTLPTLFQTTMLLATFGVSLASARGTMRGAPDAGEMRRHFAGRRSDGVAAPNHS